MTYSINFPFGPSIPLVRVGQDAIVPFSALPAPFNTVIPSKQGPDGVFAYEWEYEDKQYGSGGLSVDDEGNGVFRFKFSNGKKVDGDTFSATATLLDDKLQPMHTFFARAGVNSAGFSGGAKERRIKSTIKQPPEWWKKVSAIKFHYQMIDTVDDLQVWEAIQKVLEALSKGDGSSEPAPTSEATAEWPMWEGAT